MRIFAIGLNYVKHIAELGSLRSEEPVVFTKPDTALVRHNEPFHYPDISNEVHHEVELVIRINKEGKNISEQHANNYYDSIGIGIDFTARDLQRKAKKEGRPWDIAKGFDESAPISDVFLSAENFKKPYEINFKLEVDGQLKQQGNTGLLLFSFDYIIAYLSRFFTLKVGDLIFTGTPEGVGPVFKGNKLSAYIENEKLLDCEVK